MTPDNTQRRRQRRSTTGEMYSYNLCRACRAASTKRYDQSWKGVDNKRRTKERKKAA